MLLSSHAAVGGYNAAGEMVMLRASGTSSEGSAYAVTQDWAAGASPHQPSPPSPQPLRQHHAGGEGAAVEVQRTAPRGSLPPSSQLAGNARELLEVFARMYNQRPAVDYAVVAQMLDQEADPGEVEEAEEADEEALRQVDELGAQQRSAPPSDASGDAYSAVWQQQQRQQQGAYAALWQQQQQQQQGPYGQVSPQQYLDVEVAVVENVQQQAAAAPRSEPGSAQQSLLPGMLSPPATSLLPPPAVWSLQPEEVEICKRPDGSYWQLGTGAFGTCYKGLYHGRQLVAVKVLHRVEERRRGEEFEREVALLKDLRDRNIVQFIGACLDGPTPMLVTEFMEFGDLWRALPLKNPQGHRIFAWHKRCVCEAPVRPPPSSLRVCRVSPRQKPSRPTPALLSSHAQRPPCAVRRRQGSVLPAPPPHRASRPQERWAAAAPAVLLLPAVLAVQMPTRLVCVCDVCFGGEGGVEDAWVHEGGQQPQQTPGAAQPSLSAIALHRHFLPTHCTPAFPRPPFVPPLLANRSQHPAVAARHRQDLRHRHGACAGQQGIPQHAQRHGHLCMEVGAAAAASLCWPGAGGGMTVLGAPGPPRRAGCVCA
jgi:hypothetical protein